MDQKPEFDWTRTNGSLTALLCTKYRRLSLESLLFVKVTVSDCFGDRRAASVIRDVDRFRLRFPDGKPDECNQTISCSAFRMSIRICRSFRLWRIRV